MTDLNTNNGLPEELTGLLKESLAELKKISAQLQQQGKGIDDVYRLFGEKRCGLDHDATTEQPAISETHFGHSPGPPAEKALTISPASAKPSTSETGNNESDLAKKFAHASLDPMHLGFLLDVYQNQAPPPQWIAQQTEFKHLCRVDVRYSPKLRTQMVENREFHPEGLPYDGRITFGFQKQNLITRNATQALKVIKKISETMEKLRDVHGEFLITDSFHPHYYIEYGFEGRYLLPPQRCYVPTFTDQLQSEIYAKRQRLIQTGAPGLEGQPWRRLVELRGISRILPPTKEKLSTEDREMPFLDFIRSTISGQSFNHAFFEHLDCRRYLNGYPITGHTCINFQITFYEVLQVSSRDDYDQVSRSIWKTGEIANNDPRYLDSAFMFSAGDKRSFRRSAYNIVGATEEVLKFPSHSSDYWTIMLLIPDSCSLHEKRFTNEGVDFVTAIFHYIGVSTRQVCKRWQALLIYFFHLLDESETLLEPEKHDILLVDDARFSKSKKYFWAMNMLKEVDSDIEAVILQLIMFKDTSADSPIFSKFRIPSEELSNERQQTVVANAGKLIDELKTIQKAFHEQRELARTLRDGLFNASAVMETRASTRLGENVKLLTFVSIFFLPLSFTMSIWSINNNLPNSHYIPVVGGVLAITTYLVVFNLNNIVNIVNLVIGGVKLRIISHMKSSSDSAWKKRGGELAEASLLKTRDEIPSTWRIVQYAPTFFRAAGNEVLRGLLRGVRNMWRKEARGDAEQSTELRS